MTTNKLLKKMELFLFYNSDTSQKHVPFASVEFADIFAKYAQPLKYKINQRKTHNKMIIILKNVMNNGFIEESMDENSNKINKLFTITKKGYERLQDRQDKIIKAACGISGAILGAGLTLIVNLIK
jgi:hypothetical protein